MKKNWLIVAPINLRENDIPENPTNRTGLFERNIWISGAKLIGKLMPKAKMMLFKKGENIMRGRLMARSV